MDAPTAALTSGDAQEVAKRAACDAALELVEDGMVVGLGTGSTAMWFTLGLAARISAGLRARAVATSDATAALAAGHGIPLIDLDRRGLDIAVDGADAVDDDLRLIKGRGGAMVREKVIAAAAARFVVVIDDRKLSRQLRGRVPVELIQFGCERTLALLEATGAAFAIRRDAGGVHMISDNGNLIADGLYEVIDDPEGLSARLDALPGVVGHGLFLGMTDLVMVGHDDGAVERRGVPG